MKKTKKWLEYFKDQEKPSDQFYYAMLDQLPTLFDNLVGVQIDWKKVWLFTEPIRIEDVISVQEIEGKYIHSLYAQLCINGTTTQIYGFITYEMKSPNLLEFRYEQPFPIKFELKDYEKWEKNFKYFPSIEDTRKRLHKILLSYKSVNIVYEEIDHEGLYVLEFCEELSVKAIEELSKNLDDLRSLWNTQSNSMYFHSILPAIEDNNYDASSGFYYSFYYDMGSANIDAHKFILEKIIDIYPRIKAIKFDFL